MKSVGLVVEYNPFHNGHAFHVDMAKKASDAEVVVAVMSGNFLQRGEPALVSKWARCEMALKAGVDLIFELPYQFATQQAETFAKGAVSLLTHAQCNYLCFGSESGEVDNFKQTLNFLETNNLLYQQRVKVHVQKGVSYPKALSLAFNDLSPHEEAIDLTKPNNILGFHYLKAIHDLHSPIVPLTIKRKNANYHDEHFASETIASATSIRTALFSRQKNNRQIIKQFVPEATSSLLEKYLEQFGLLHNWEEYWPLLQYRIIHSSIEDLKNIYEVEEGLEHRIFSVALKAATFQQFIDEVKTKRYTRTRLQRLCVHILNNTTKTCMKERMEKLTYMRLLGMTNKGREYLNHIKNHLEIPLISKLSSYDQKDIALDIKASRVYALAAKKNKALLFKQDYSQPPVFIR